MTALAIYNEFESVEALTNIDLHELNDFITEKGKNLFSDPDEIAKAIQKAFDALDYREQTLLEKRNAICMRCGRVSPMSSRSSFEELATLFEGSGTSGAERAYRKALNKLTTILVEEGILHAVRLKRKNITRKKKEIATAIYLYQVDYDGEWGEIYFDFVNRTTEIRKLAEWDRMISKVFSKKAICYIQTHPLLVNLKEIVISFSL